MTATERLRQLLDERGVEWKASKAPLPVTSLHGAHGFKFTAMNPYGVTDYLLVQTNTLDEWPHLTPEQAIEATLGAVHRKTHTKEYCNRCEGAVLPKWKKCPWCGEPLEEV